MFYRRDKAPATATSLVHSPKAKAGETAACQPGGSEKTQGFDIDPRILFTQKSGDIICKGQDAAQQNFLTTLA